MYQSSNIDLNNIKIINLIIVLVCSESIKISSFSPQVLQRLAREHVTPAAVDHNPIPEPLDTLISMLELIKTRVIVMGVDMRKLFIGNLMCGLIEKTTEPKVIYVA